MGVIITEGDRIGSGSPELSTGSYLLDRASAVPFLLPGREVTVKL